MSEDEVSTERAEEIDRVNRWSERLEQTWDEAITGLGIAMRTEYIHKFVTSFSTLSKARRDLGGIDKPRRMSVDTSVKDEKPPVSIDREVEKLAKNLSVNDGKPKKPSAGN